MAGKSYGIGLLLRLRVRSGDSGLLAHLTNWHRTAGRVAPGTRLHILLEADDGTGDAYAVHIFENAHAFERLMNSLDHEVWMRELADYVDTPPEERQVVVRWNAAADARPKVSVSIDRDIHASVQELIGRLLDRHPRTPAEDLYLSMLQSVAADYEQEYPLTIPEEGDLR